MQRDKILYKGKEYASRWIANGACISTIELSNALEADNFEGVAQHIDEAICGYVTSQEILLSDKELSKLCKSQGII